jgi:hypothetical protein
MPARIDRLFAELKNIPIEDYEGRLNAFYLAAQYALNKRQMNKSLMIIDEALEYIKTIPEQARHPAEFSLSEIPRLIEQIHDFNEMRLAGARREAEAANARIDSWLAAAKGIPAENYEDRLDSLAGAVQRAVDELLLDGAQKILDEALRYIKTIPEQHRRSPQITNLIQVIDFHNNTYLPNLRGKSW